MENDIPAPENTPNDNTADDPDTADTNEPSVVDCVASGLGLLPIVTIDPENPEHANLVLAWSRLRPKPNAPQR